MREAKAMRAVVHDRYGPPDVLRLEEVARQAQQKTGNVVLIIDS
jgi:hypothetical protein